MPQEGPEAAKSMTITKVDGTTISSSGVTLPNGKKITHEEYEKHGGRTPEDEETDSLLTHDMREETTRSSGHTQE